MKILFVNFIKSWGGGESWTYQVMDELKKRNHAITLLSNTQSKLLVKAQENDIKTYSFNVNKLSFLNFCLISKIKESLIKIKPDVIILNSSLELKTVGLIIKYCGCPKVIFTRGIPKKMKMKPLKRYLFSNVVSNVIVNSKYVRKSISNITKLLRNDPEVIYHGIQPNSLIFADCNSKNIAIVGRLSFEKGVDIALRVMQNVLLSEPDANLWIIGDGKEKENLITLTLNLGINKSVKFFGFVNDVENLLKQCSILIMTSRWEGFGLVLLEAMKLKMPCLAFDHIAANEIIIDNETGFLIPNMNIRLMCEKITYLLSNPEVGEQMGQKGNDLLKESFTIKKSIDQYEKLIERN